MDVESISGANIYTIHQFLKDNKARVIKYTHLVLHVGTNDIGNGLCSKIITQYYCNLLELITHNFSIKIIMSAILSRPIDFDRTKQLVIETNNCLAKLALKRNVQFVKTYKQFVKQPGSLYKRKGFCKDGLHLSYLGVSVRRNLLIGVVNHVH
jgi:lysophospholipase L1-like esterase